jgi:hypothetical protein
MMGWSENSCSQTGVDLIITGTNISRKAPRYFSVYHTPDFPVIEAVQISMNIPMIFKPIYVSTDVREGDRDQNLKYQGLYGDGGVLNNYPIHAFDFIEISQQPSNDQARHLMDITFRGVKSRETQGAYPIAGNPKLREYDCDCVLGMRLQEKEKVLTDYPKEHYYPPDENVFIDFLKDLGGSLLYGSEEGQIRSLTDEERTVEFYATVEENKLTTPLLKRLSTELKDYSFDDKPYALKVSDFSTPAINGLRNQKALKKVKEIVMDKVGKDMETFLNS